MADNEHITKIILKGEDQTGGMFKGASKDAATYIKQLEKILEINDSTRKALEVRRRETHQTYKEQLELILKNNRAYNEANKAAQDAGGGGADAAEKHASALRKVSGEIADVAKGYLKAGLSAETARRAFLQFAENDRMMTHLQNTIGATAEEIAAFKKEFKEIASVTRTPFDQTVAGINKLKSGLGTTIEDAINKSSRLNIVAKALSVVPEEMAKLTTDWMRNMDIPATRMNETLEMIYGGIKKGGLDVKDLIGRSGEMGEMARAAGYKGEEGLARMIVQLGIAGDVMGDSSRGGQLLMQTFGNIEKMGSVFDMPDKQWKSMIDNVRKVNGDVDAFVISHLKTLPVREKEIAYGKMDIKQRMFLQALERQDTGIIGDKIKAIKELRDGQEAVNAGMRVNRDAQASIEALTTSVSLLADEFGKLLATLGVPTAIVFIAEKFNDLAAAIEKVWGVWEKIKKGDFSAVVGPHGLSLPNPFAVGEATGKGLTAEGEGIATAQERAEKLLQEKLERGKNQTAPGDFKGVPPGWRPPGWVPGGVAPGGAMPGGAKPMSFSPGAGASGVSRMYGGSADAAYLPADYRTGGGLLHRASFGGGAVASGGGAPAGFQAAGPPGPGRGTSYGGQTDVPVRRGGGQPSSVPGEGTVPQGGATASGSYEGERVNQDVMQTRIQQANAEWMKDPKNQQLIYRTLQAEGGMKNMGANLEQMSNYAAARGKTLQQVVEARGRNQFYGPLRRFRGDPGSGPMMPHERDAYNSAWTAEKQAAWDKASKDVFAGGSNRIGYRTDQGTVGDPNYNPSKMVKVGGNMFGVQPGTEAWVNAQRGKPQASVGSGEPPIRAEGARVPRPAETSAELGGDDPKSNLQGVTSEMEKAGLTVTSGYRSPQHRLSRANPHSSHSRALAFDVRARNAAQSDAAMAKIRDQMSARGLVEGRDYKILDEVRRPSGHATGPHVHTQMTPEGMKRYRDSQRQQAPAAATATTDEPKGEGAAQQGAREGTTPAPAASQPPDRDVTQRVNLKVNDNDVQFARSSMRRSADREVREARWSSYSDIGAA